MPCGAHGAQTQARARRPARTAAPRRAAAAAPPPPASLPSAGRRRPQERYTPSVATYFPRVPGFSAQANGDPDAASLRGPARTEARQAAARERLVAAAEVKILHAELKLCYFREGVNHLTACADLVKRLAEKLRSPSYGAPGGSPRNY